jgi:SAM-dependent methyltransferase
MDPTWRDEPQRYDEMLGAFGRQAQAAAGIGTGEQVLDVGAGASTTPVELARRVGAAGHVGVLEISAELASVGRGRAIAAGFPDIEWISGDVSAPFARVGLAPGRYDAAFSRFALMLAPDPQAAFANLHRVLRPGGRLAFTCWQELERNGCFTVPAEAVERVLPGLAATMFGSTPGPGPFAFADEQLLRELIGDAGFAGMRIEPMVQPVRIGSDIDDALGFLERRFGDAAALLDDETATRLRSSAREVLAPYAQPDGVRLSAAAWLVVATRP